MTDPTPTRFVAGDSVSWTWKDDTYRPTAGYTTGYSFVIPGQNKTVAGIAQPDDSWLFSILSADSAWPAGSYGWQRYVTLTGERTTVTSGRTVVHAAYAGQGAGSDPRSQYEQIIAAIDDTLQGRVNSDIKSYSFNGRSLDKLTLDELMTARGYYQSLLNSYLQNTGQGGRSRIIRTVI